MGAPNYKAIFAGIATAKPMTNFAARLPLGKNKVALLYYGVRESQQEKGNIIEADFSVQPGGEKRSWAWFPDMPSWAGKFQKDRARKFLECVQASLKSDKSLDDIAMDLADEKQEYRGLLLDVEVVQVFEKDGTPARGTKGDAIFNEIWTAIPQTKADIQAMQAKLDGAPATTPAVLSGLD